MAKGEVNHNYSAATVEDEYDDRDGPSALSMLWGKNSKSDESKKPSKSVFSKIRREKRDEKGGEWKKIP